MIRNAELARAISEKFGLSAKEAENFVSTMIEIVNDALRYERQVKIKGLGTFKVLGVESRESVDVNTGRRITIGERDKISFTPDVTLRDRVNSPFAQFETFVMSTSPKLMPAMQVARILALCPKTMKKISRQTWWQPLLLLRLSQSRRKNRKKNQLYLTINQKKLCTTKNSLEIMLRN